MGFKIATTLHFDLIAAEDSKEETHGENGLDFADLGVFMSRMKRKSEYESDDDKLKPEARKPRSNAGSDASHVIEDDKGGDSNKTSNEGD